MRRRETERESMRSPSGRVWAIVLGLLAGIPGVAVLSIGAAALPRRRLGYSGPDVSGVSSGTVTERWAKNELEDLADDLRSSIRVRENEQLRLGEHGPHRARIYEEQQLLRQINNRLSGS